MNHMQRLFLLPACLAGLLAAGCGFAEHAEDAQRLEARLAELERQWRRYQELDAQAMAEREAAHQAVRQALEALEKFLRQGKP